MERSIYESIAERTGKQIYLGIVGPVRTGKSTFIKSFMEQLVLPNIDNVYQKERARDELPQSGSGRTIMTAEPKFVPEEAVRITLDDKVSLSVRMIDCVGYMVDGAVGQFEDDAPRMVMTPWSEEELPLAEAAEIGTRKVITEHSTIGLVVTTDGTIGDIPRESYVPAEERIVRELQEIRKPFCVLLNSASPEGAPARELAAKLSGKYGVAVLPVDCMSLKSDDITSILRSVLMEFPVKEFAFTLPDWLGALPDDDAIKTSVYDSILETCGAIRTMRQVGEKAGEIGRCQYVETVSVGDIDLGDGVARITVTLPGSLYYRILSEQSGIEIRSEGDLLPLLCEMARIREEYSLSSDSVGMTMP